MTSIRDLSDQVGPIQPLTPDQINRARHKAAEHAHDPADLRHLLDVMGLTTTQEDT